MIARFAACSVAPKRMIDQLAELDAYGKSMGTRVTHVYLTPAEMEKAKSECGPGGNVRRVDDIEVLAMTDEARMLEVGI